MKTSGKNENTLAREWSVKFIYQCEVEKVFYFNSIHFMNFIKYHEIDPEVTLKLSRILRGTYSLLFKIDELIKEHSQGWKIDRISPVDKAIIRVSLFQLLANLYQPKIVINEAVELAKKFGEKKSYAFVNGIVNSVAIKLDKI